MSAHLICGGLTFEATPIELREKVAFRDAQLPEALVRMREALGLREAVLVSTCNRVEYFGHTIRPELAAEAWPEFLRGFHAVPDDFRPLSFQLSGVPCVEHLFALASGLKSMVVGETEILGQLKDAYDVARVRGQTGKWLNRLFQSSFAAAKSVRSRTAITRGSVSVGSVAVELAEKIFGELQGCRAMVLGAGDTSEKTARSLLAHGVPTLLVANRTFDRAASLAAELGGEAVHWEQWEEHALQADIMISSTSAPHYVLTSEKLEPLLKRRGRRPLFLIDLAVPRDFEPSINLLDDVYLYDIDDLQSIAHAHLSERRTEIGRSVEILKPHVDRYMAWAARQRRDEDAQRRNLAAGHMTPVVLGTRGSPLALAQTRLVLATLKLAWPRRTFEIRTIKTQGDRLSESPATDAKKATDKGLFTGELEQALREKQIHIAVHSLKDLPTEDSDGLIVAGVPVRADARDVLITRGPATIADLPASARLATGSVRRAAQLRLARADLEMVDIRGNIDTRLRKFRENADWSGLVIAAAGLERLKPDVEGLTVTPLPFEIMLPAPGQGALALQTRKEADDIIEIVRKVNDPASVAAVKAERMLLHALGGGCEEPIAAHARPEPGGKLRLDAVAWLFGETEPRRGHLARKIEHAERLGIELAIELSR